VARWGRPETLARLPWRGPGGDRPELALPPDELPLLGPARRLRKRWRYVGAFCEQFMLCAARVHVGPFGQTFWALLDRGSGELLERTRRLGPRARGEVWSERSGAGRWQIGTLHGEAVTRIDSGAFGAELRIGAGRWAESICANGEGGYVWTRKRITPIECDLRLPGGRRYRRGAWGIEDESAGYHPRHTTWSWSAGVGADRVGRPVGWNLVSGVNDPPERSERAVWLDGAVSEPGPVSFEGLESIAFADGSRLAFSAEAERRASENLLIVRSEYRQPFGTFSGSLPGDLELAAGFGVMERHDAVW
jgi:hypothetical protein